VAGALPQFSLGDCGGFAEPRKRGARQRDLPARNAEYGDWLVSDDIADSDAGAVPQMKASAPVLWARDYDGIVAFQSGSHAVGAACPFRPSGPRGQVALRGWAQDSLASAGRQDVPIVVCNGDETVEAADLTRCGCGHTAELGENHIVGYRMRACLRRGGRLVQTRVDTVLLPAAVPGHEDLRPNSPDTVRSGSEAFPGSNRAVEAGVSEHRTVHCE
jgi:hypothetical protein